MSWVTPTTQSPGQPATAGWANIVGGDLIQINTVIPAVSGGITGAVASGRLVGFINGGPPTTGTFAVGDYVFDVSVSTQNIWVCITAGTPGVWGTVGGAPLTGTIVPYAGSPTNVDPAGWLVCDGRLISRTIYATLYNKITNAGLITPAPYGNGDGSTTFGIPDLRGRTIFGADNMGAGAASRFLANNTMGAVGGEYTHVLTGAESGTSVHLHSNAIVDATHHHFMSGSSGGGGFGAASNSSSIGSAAQTSDAGTGVSITNANSSAANATSGHNTIPLNQIVSFIIRT